MTVTRHTKPAFPFSGISTSQIDKDPDFKGLGETEGAATYTLPPKSPK